MRFARSLHTPLCDLLQCDYPILLAGMGGVSRHELAAAVCNAGGFGVLGMVREDPAFIRAEIEATRRLTDRPFAVNLIPAATEPALLGRQVQVCIDSGVHAVSLFWDVHPPVIQRLREAGLLVLHQVGDVESALAAQTAGAHVLIAQGWEAGGHVHGTRGLLALLEGLAGSVRVPLVAAGGVVSGRALVAALAMGAEGVQPGSLFLATDESFAHDFHKQRLVEACREDTVHTTVFDYNWPPDAPVRVMPNPVTEGAVAPAEPREVIANEGGKPVFLGSTDSPLKNSSGQLELMPLYAGQSAYLIKTVTSARERIDHLLREASELLTGWQYSNQPLDWLIGRDESQAGSGSGGLEAASPACQADRLSGDYLGNWSAKQLAEAAGEWLLELRCLLAGLALGDAAGPEGPACGVAARSIFDQWVLVEDALRRICIRSGGDVPERRILSVEQQLRTAEALPSLAGKLAHDMKAANHHVADPTQRATLNWCVGELEASTAALATR